MIVTRLIGGLGNQMFQYAAGRALALRHGVDLKLDRRAFDHYGLRGYGLEAFALTPVDAEAQDIPPARGPSRLRRMLGGQPHTYRLSERSLRFDPAVLNAPRGAYLDGYWQSERYFTDHAAAIRADFVITAPPAPPNADMLARIAGARTVSIHVRRGDYVSNPEALAVHGTCPPNYYAAAVELLQSRVGADLLGVVFSDDHAWARANLKLPIPTLHADQNDAATAHEDLRLMSACRHHIVANSTFSWWGAWLDPRPESLVIAPRRWFAAPHMDATDLVPERWLRI